jgi:hypothetical protein
MIAQEEIVSFWKNFIGAELNPVVHSGNKCLKLLYIAFKRFPMIPMLN